MILAGGVESMSRVPMGADGGPYAMDPTTNYDGYFVPQGIGADLIATIEGFSRADVDTFALESQIRAAKAQANGYFDRSIVPVLDQNGLTMLDRDEHVRPDTTIEGLAKLSPSFEAQAKMGGFDEVALQRYPTSSRSTTSTTPGTPRASSTAPALILHGQRRGRQAQRHDAARPRRRRPPSSGRAHDHADRSRRRRRRRRWPRPGMTAADIDLMEINEAFAAVAHADHARPRTSTTTAPTSTAARSPWVTRWAPPAR